MRFKSVQGVFISIAVIVLAVSLLIGLPGSGQDELEAANGPADWTLLGLDARDYNTNIAVKVPLSDRQWINHHKLIMSWNKVERYQDVFDWSYYDNQVNAMLADGAQSILLMFGSSLPE